MSIVTEKQTMRTVSMENSTNTQIQSFFCNTDKYLEATDSSFNHSNERLPAYASVKIQWEMTWASSIWHRFLVGSRIPAFKTYDPLENSS
jgi:hypothetical protein